MLLLTRFDPVVWDRRCFELLRGWKYRLEAYTPAPRRTLGYYAVPQLWGDRVIGWGNVGVVSGAMTSIVGYVVGRAPRDADFREGLQAELARMRLFPGIED